MCADLSCTKYKKETKEWKALACDRIKEGCGRVHRQPEIIARFFFLQIRLVVEEGLNQLPYSKCEVVTPTGEIDVKKGDSVVVHKTKCSDSELSLW